MRFSANKSQNRVRFDGRKSVREISISGRLKRDLLSHFEEARFRTDELFQMVRSHALYERPIVERHRIVFYLGHLEAFDWNLICAGRFGMKSFHSEFDRLFAFGIDPINGNLPDDQPADWPGEAEIHAYNRRVRNAVDQCLDRASEDQRLWSEPAWEWVVTSGIRHPKFWKHQSGNWMLRTMFGEIPFQPSWPVYVSHAEAEAYARWTHKSLPTEAQFHRAAFGTSDGNERLYPWGNVTPQPRHGNFNFAGWTPSPVDAHPQGNSAFGVADLIGNGWEWTSTIFAPFPGFEALPFYPGYSANFFDGGHYVLKGGSPRTASLLLRRSFRNWFQPYYPNIYASFRCVDN